MRFALSARDVALIHGPPGTGKTTTVVELIRQAILRGRKVLASAPSNMAVDNVFERLMALYGPAIARRLTVQYRMHEAIMDFSSLEFYEAELEADASVRDHLLADLPDVAATPLTQSAAEFIDTAGASFDEELEPDGESRLNRREAALVCRKVQELLDSGVPPRQIAVIAPYAAQVRLLREQLPIQGLEAYRTVWEEDGAV